ncbi:YceI family protein [Salinisphaera hydrothermalis]|uniref:YceI family protein n=1 Tax=Salinisphaera hydrothermalis TaxID=563188 RepID=UPI003340A25C
MNPYIWRRSTGLALAATVATAAHAAPDLKPGTYKIDISHTYAHFRINHMGLSTMHGRMDARKGTIRIGADPADSSVTMIFDPASVDTGDDSRDEHLRKMDGFFHVEEYPSITFKSTQVTFDGPDHSAAKVTGKLTLHGVTRPVTLDVDHIACKVNPLEHSKYTCGFNAETEISRSAFGMNAYSKLVGDQVHLSFEVEANKPVDSGR